MAENKSGKRIIAIAVSPKAYDEILTLKGKRTWTQWLLELMLLEKPGHEVLYAELSDLTKPKVEKSEVKKPKAEQKPKKPKVEKPKVEKTETVKGGAPVDLSKIAKHQEAEAGKESGELVIEK